MRSSSLSFAVLSFASGCFAHIASEWPAGPVGGSSLLADDILSEKAHRALESAQEVPNFAMTHIILWSSLAMFAALIYACLALFNMEVTNDSLLFSKSKSD